MDSIHTPRMYRRTARTLPSTHASREPPAPRRFREQGLTHQEQDGQAQWPHVFLGIDGLDLLTQFLAHHALQPSGNLVDTGLPVLGTHNRATRDLRNLRELRFPLGRELGRQRLTVFVAPQASNLSAGGHVWNRLGSPSADLNDVDAGAFLCAILGDARGIAFQILAVGDEDHHAHVVLRQRVAREDLTGLLERPSRCRSSNGHVVGLELPEELGNGCPVTREWEAHGLTREGHRANSAFARAIRDGVTSRAYMLFE